MPETIEEFIEEIRDYPLDEYHGDVWAVYLSQFDGLIAQLGEPREDPEAIARVTALAVAMIEVLDQKIPSRPENAAHGWSGLCAALAWARLGEERKPALKILSGMRKWRQRAEARGLDYVDAMVTSK